MEKDTLIYEVLKEILAYQMKIFFKLHEVDFKAELFDPKMMDNGRRLILELDSKIKIGV